VKRSTKQVAVAVAEAAAVPAVDDEDGVQWRRWGVRSMAAAAFDGGHATTSRARNERTRGQSKERTRERRNKRQRSNQPAQDDERVAQ
jgi:hypothetical protein